MINKRSTRSSGIRQLDLSEIASDIQTCCSQCGLSPNQDGHDGDNHDRISYCKQCGMVASKAAGMAVSKDSQDWCKLTDNEERGTTIPIPRQEPADLMSQMWISHSKTSDQTEKNFAICLGEITRVGRELSLQPVLASKAGELCMIAFEKGVTKGTSLNILSAAIVYASARLASLPVTIDEVAITTKLAKSDVISCFRKLQRRLNLRFKVPSPEAHVTKIMTILSMPIESELQTAVNSIIRSADKSGRTLGKNPAAVAAAALYLALTRVDNVSKPNHRRLTHRKLALAVNVTETTIRRACRNLEQL